MANAASERFIKNLIAVSCRRFKPDSGQVEFYKSKLAKWYLSESQWAAAMSRFAADWAEEGLPPISLIYNYLKNVTSQIDKKAGYPIMTVRINGVSHVLAEADMKGDLHPKRIDPGNLPTLPDYVTDPHLVLPDSMLARQDEADYRSQIDSLVGELM